MNSLFEMERNRSEAKKRYNYRKAKIERDMERLKKEIDKLRYPHLLNYLKKLGKAVLPKIKGAVSFETMGPFGLGSECSIYFYAQGKNGKKGRTLAGATFTRYGDGFGLKDYSKKINRYSPGTIGEMNGGNYDTIEITEKMTLDWFVRFAKKGYNK